MTHPNDELKACREEFEKWARSRGLIVCPGRDGHEYSSMQVENAWNEWLSACNNPSKDEANVAKQMPLWLKERCAHAIRQAYADYVHWTGGDVDHRDIEYGQSLAAMNAVLKEMGASYTCVSAKDEAKGGEAVGDNGEVTCEVVGHVKDSEDGPFIEWTVEGGIHDLPPGLPIFALEGNFDTQDGWASLYTSPRPTADEERDAARYRWLRNDQTGAVEDAILIDRYGDIEVKFGESLDLVIDEAMAGRGEVAND